VILYNFSQYVNISQDRSLFRKLLLVKYIGELQKLLACAYSVSVRTRHFSKFLWYVWCIINSSLNVNDPFQKETDLQWKISLVYC